MPLSRRHKATAAMIAAAVLLLAACGESPAPAPPTDTARLQPQTTPAPPQVAAPPVSVPARVPAAPSPPARAPARQAGPAPLVLSIEDAPFEAAPAPGFGAVPTADWLAAQPRAGTPAPLLPDLFTEAADPRRVNVEGELLLDANKDTSRMVDGVSMKIQISTD